MGKVKQNIETLAEQMNFLEKTIELISQRDPSKTLSIQVDDAHLPTLENILANLRMVHTWVMLPDFHQAALQVLDEAHKLQSELQKGGDGNMALGQYYDRLYILIKRYQAMESEDIMGIASLALIAVAKFVVPRSQRKEVEQ